MPAARGPVEAAAHELLADLGFLLVPGSPFDRGPAYLLVALRPRPTHAHFDPEAVEFWSMEGGAAEPTRLEWPMLSASGSYSWGTIKVIDRLNATNRFVSFGGQVNVSRDARVHAALFRSDAPILALGGHSGPADPLAGQICGFFARLRAAAGKDAALGTTSASLSPVALYASFLNLTLGQYEKPVVAEWVPPRLLSVLRAERRRCEAESSVDARAGCDLAVELAALTPC